MLDDAQAFGADYLVVDKHLIGGIPPRFSTVYASDTYVVAQTVSPPLTIAPARVMA